MDVGDELAEKKREWKAALLASNFLWQFTGRKIMIVFVDDHHGGWCGYTLEVDNTEMELTE